MISGVPLMLVENLYDYYNEDTLIELYESWDNLSEEKRKEYCKDFFKDFLEFQIDEYNKGLALWNDILNEEKKNIYEDKLNVIELN